MNDLRIAVIGCGRMGTLRAEGAARAGATIVAVCDPDRAAAERLAYRFPGCQALTRGEGLNLANLHALFSCTPPASRGALEVAAARCGTAIFMEKPVGISAAQMSRLFAAVRESGVVTAVGYMNRYRRSVQRTRADLVGKEVLGAVGHWVNGPYHVPWWQDRTQSGGPLNEQATHIVDLARYLMGDVSRVHAARSDSPAPGALENGVSLILEFTQGPVATIFYSCTAPEKRIGIEVFTTSGSIRLEGWDFHRGEPPAEGVNAHTLADRNQIFHEETAAFLDDVRKGASSNVLSDLEDAMRTQAVMDAAMASLADGRGKILHVRAAVVDAESSL